MSFGISGYNSPSQNPNNTANTVGWAVGSGLVGIAGGAGLAYGIGKMRSSGKDSIKTPGETAPATIQGGLGGGQAPKLDDADEKFHDAKSQISSDDFHDSQSHLSDLDSEDARSHNSHESGTNPWGAPSTYGARSEASSNSSHDSFASTNSWATAAAAQTRHGFEMPHGRV